MTGSLPPLSSHQYTALSFDLIGTLLNYEITIYPLLKPIAKTLPPSHPFNTPFPVPLAPGAKLRAHHPLIEAIDRHETVLITSNPRIKFEDVLRQSYRGVAADAGVEVSDADVEAFAGSMPDWAVFSDTAKAMQKLKAKGYKLFGLTNNSRAGAQSVLENGLKEVDFDAVWTAEEIGSYKPDQRNFEFLLDHVKSGWDVSPEQLIHVAHGVASDQVPAENNGLRHVWVEREVDNRGGVDIEPMKLLSIVPDMEELARKVVGD